MKPDLVKLTKDLVDSGKIIEAGWIGLRFSALPLDAPKIQLEEMRNAFFAGAQHLLASLMAAMDPGDDPTGDNMARMDKIQAELREFINNYQLKNTPSQGRA